ncbi:S58 family peptidase [Candidimonas sp. SYP-B2681]|uniref:DmpA family aminopeptidase n=1 Tax=Candidimonas sp. SYP-B2681 TaxID=2497686 RepID=UPI000F88F6A8|nr:P1 family peptidase [Candidimonas sp. SYP-B2681]RTZ45541.1 S58 family peptidase [Candidimonas sp. SYP-B2681]
MTQHYLFDAPRVGLLPSGPRNLISDVPGVRVGHTTLSQGDVQTGVTIIKPHAQDPFLFQVPAAVSVINGFGKSVGLVQVQELGVLETPIALTNTFSVGEVATAQIREAIAAHPAIGRDWPTVNPLVFECNDGYLNDIQAFAVSANDYAQACQSATEHFEQGSVGAGRGMSCFALKGGIGSASRVATVSAGQQYVVGALVLANFGRLANLTVKGRLVGQYLLANGLSVDRKAVADSAAGIPEKGSIIILLATNAPLDTRQLHRVSKRAAAGLARMGSVYGHGSGDIALAFTTAYQIPAIAENAMPATSMLHESRIDPLFETAAEATEQAIVNALWAATSVRGRMGNHRWAINDVLPQWREYFEKEGQ